jgi:TetR/AcrR family transcriptional repressor of nem operon
MRVSREKSAQNRERILNEAARLFRERGLDGVGVDALTEAAGLTHGSLYSQFGSKEQLSAQALERAFAGAAAKAPPGESLSSFAARYLSARHRDAPGDGCTLAALGCEMPRQGAAVRSAFTQGLQGSIARLAALLPAGAKKQREDQALACLATLVGALVLARAVDQPALSDRILSAGRAHLGRQARPPSKAAPARSV